jgi:hypothetical protein
MGYYSKSTNDIFTQNKERRIHESMDPNGIILRESRDSEVHPNTVPIIISLDLTGSMGRIPHELVKDGLPKLVSGIIQNGVPDPAILFLGIGDHECDRAPLQVGQFESGDEELDMWLTRTYIESGGGGNAGESYGLAMYFAARHCVTDAWEKRNKKGFLFIIGDEPNLKTYPSNALKEIMGNGDIATFTDQEILEEVQEKWNVYVINPGHGNTRAERYWKEILGENYIVLSDYTEVADRLKDIVVQNTDSNVFTQSPTSTESPITKVDVEENEIIL